MSDDKKKKDVANATWMTCDDCGGFKASARIEEHFHVRKADGQRRRAVLCFECREAARLKVKVKK